MTHQNLWHPIRHEMMALTLNLTYLSHHHHHPMNPRNLPKMVKVDWKGG